MPACPRAYCVRYKLPLFSLTALVILLATGCAPGNPVADTNQPVEPLSVQLSWTYDFQFAPFFAAEQNGHFATENLDVTLERGGFDDNGEYINAIDQVVGGEVHFGVTDAYNLILARAEGAPIVAIAAIYQRSPGAIISLHDQNITRPQDLVGKRVALTAGAVTWTYNAMLTRQGIALDEIELVPRTSFGIDPLLNGEADAMSGWIINEGVLVEEAGYAANFIVMGDYGTDTYPMLLFTTEDFLVERPEVARRFLSALLAGMNDAVTMPNQSAELVLSYDATLDLEGQRRRFQASLPFLNPAGSRLGWMEAEVWEATYQILLAQNILAQPLDVESAYTLVFLEDIAGSTQ